MVYVMTCFTLYTHLLSPLSQWLAQAVVLFETWSTNITDTSVILLLLSSSQQWQTGKAQKLIQSSSKHIHKQRLCSSPKYQKDNRQQIMPTNQNTAISSNFRKKITRNQSKALSGITQSSNQGNSKSTTWKNQQPQFSLAGY